MADLHGSAERLRPLEGADVDVVVFCGDLHNLELPDRMRPVAEALAALGPPVLIVPGNMDPKETAPKVWKEAGLQMVHRGSWVRGGYGFVGFGGMVARDERRLSDLNRFYSSDEDVYRSLNRLWGRISGCGRRIVLTHQPPRGTRDLIYNGERGGSPGLRRFVEEAVPDLLLCGHIHEDRGEGWIGSTRIVNVGELRQGHAAVIDLEGEISVQWIEP